MSASSPPLASPSSAGTSLASKRMPGTLDELRHGRVPIYEPASRTLGSEERAHGPAHFTSELGAAREADLVFLAVGTPMRRGDGYADLSYVYQALEEIAPHLTRLHRHHDEIDSARRHQPRDRAAPEEAQAGCGFRRLLEPGIPARGLRDPGLYPSRPRARGRDEERARAVMERVYKPLRCAMRRSCS